MPLKITSFILFVSTLLVSCTTRTESTKQPPLAERSIPTPGAQESWKAFQSEYVVQWASIDLRYPKDVFTQTGISSWKGQGWKGERIHTQVLLSSNTALRDVQVQVSDVKHVQSGQTFPLEAIQTGFVRYVVTDELNKDKMGGCGHRIPGDYDSSLVADGIDYRNTIDQEAQTTRPIWVSIQIPSDVATGLYKGTIVVSGENNLAIGKLDFELDVLDRVLPNPKDWSFHLDLWQHPYAVSRVTGTEPFSAAHFKAMEPIMKQLAQAGQKVITTSINYDPWNGQTEDIYQGMIRWTKNQDGSWTFDYSDFDRWVAYAMSQGISQQIACYSMIPWNLKFYYHDAAINKDTFLVAKPGTEAYAAHWKPMLQDFVVHLKAKGWYEKTCIAMDERPMEDMLAALAVIREVATDFKVSLAGNYHPELAHEIYDYCVTAAQTFTDAEFSWRKERNWPTTYYTCCSEPYPNTFTFSAPAEGAFYGIFAAAKGFDGYLRWAVNSWVQNPWEDSRFRSWAAGDTYLLYPDGGSSIRFERMVEGIQQFEKIKILRQSGQSTTVDSLLQRFTIDQIPTRSAATMVAEVKALLNQ
jgi:hypothetical protein